MELEELEEKFSSQLDKLSALDARVKFDMGDDGIILIDGTQSPATLSKEDDEAECTVIINKSNLGKLIQGDLNPMMAFTLGKLKVQGSMGIAMKLSSLFDD